VLSLLFKVKRPGAEELVMQLQSGKGDLDEFLTKYRPFIRKTVSTVCRRYITEQDDEYSIGLFAFHQAIQQYSYKKGKSFFAFAELLIKRDIIDHMRKEFKHNLVFLQEDQQEEAIEIKMALSEYMKELETSDRKDEILHFQTVLSEFKISFSDLVKDSPKHRDTRQKLMCIAQQLAHEEELLQELFQKKKLPLRRIESSFHVSRKVLESHRRYIIAICIVFVNQYTHILEYIQGGKSDE
jgi:RNA polymerase sigma factor